MMFLLRWRLCVTVLTLTALFTIVGFGLYKNVYGSSFLAIGDSKTRAEKVGKVSDDAYCAIILGFPGGTLPDGEFLLFIEDADNKFTLEVSGQYQMTGRRVRLFVDEEALSQEIAQIYEDTFGRPPSDVDLRRVRSRIKISRKFPEQGIRCKFKAKFSAFDDLDSDGNTDVVSGNFSYRGAGQSYLLDPSEGVVNPRHAASEDTGAQLAQTTQVGEEVTPAQCGYKVNNFTDGCCPSNKGNCNPQTDCFLSFVGHRWWTNFHWQWNMSYFENSQAWNPQGPFVDGEGLHLRVFRDNLGGGNTWTTSQVVSLTNFGFGTYLVAAKITKGGNSFAGLDRNIAFGLFTYQAKETGPTENPNRELDLAEISKWGFNGGACNIDKQLCTGNAQFAIQRWQARADNVHRYNIADNGEITLTMEWKGARQPVTFKQYNGLFDLETVKNQTPAVPPFTTIAAQNPFIPPEGECVQFMMNLYLADWNDNPSGKDPFKPPSDNQPWEVVITNFQYAPAQAQE